MLPKASFRPLLWIAIAVLGGAVIWTVRRQEKNEAPRSERQSSRPSPTRDGKSTSRTKSTIRPAPSVPSGEHDIEEQGRLAAKLGMDVIKTRLDEFTTKADREAFLRGAFRYAAGLDTKTALDWAWQLQGGHSQDTALMTLLCEWSGTTVMQWLGNPDFMSEGIAATLGNCMLKSGKATPQEVAGFAWNFTTGKFRAILIGKAAAVLAATNPDEAWAFGDKLKNGDSYYFTNAFVRFWAHKDPQGALHWIEAHPDKPALLRESLISSLVDTNVREAARLLETIPPDSLARRTYVTNIGVTWAVKDTQAALDWAAKLPTSEERDAALESIHQAAPIGIGAAMSDDMISTILPNSPASRAGLNIGDRIIALTTSDGTWIESRGMDPVDLVKSIRGPANTNVTLKIQSRDGGTRNVTITRQQIMMKQP